MNSLTLTLLYIYFIILLIVLPYFCKYKVFSPLSTQTDDENRAIEIYKNNFRKLKALDYIYGLNISSSKPYHFYKLNKLDLDHLFIVIATLPHNYTNDASSKYSLTQLVTELDINVRNEIDLETGILICNQSKSSFPEIDSLSNFYPVVEPKSKKRLTRNQQESLKQNFVECVNLGIREMELRPQYITVLLDSVVPYSNFLQTLNNILNTKVENMISKGELIPRKEPWLFLQLHEPVTWRPFGFNWASIKELFMVGSLGALIFNICGKALHITSTSRYERRSSSVVFSFYGSFLFITMAVMIGRPYLTELRRISPYFHNVYHQPSAVFISAVTLTFETASMMAEYLSKFSCSSYVTFSDVWDHAINTLEKPGLITSPSLIRHVAESL